jgi:hypothetical protein
LTAIGYYGGEADEQGMAPPPEMPQHFPQFHPASDEGSEEGDEDDDDEDDDEDDDDGMWNTNIKYINA